APVELGALLDVKGTIELPLPVAVDARLALRLVPDLVVRLVGLVLLAASEDSHGESVLLAGDECGGAGGGGLTEAAGGTVPGGAACAARKRGDLGEGHHRHLLHDQLRDAV